MLDLLLFLLVSLCIFMAILIKKWLIKRKRRRIKNSQFPLNWACYLEETVYLYKKIPKQFKKELHDHIKIFLAEKKFVGKNGLILTAQMKLIIASQACILLLGDNKNRRNYFPYLKYIHIYPEDIEKGTNQDKQPNLLLGESSVGNKSGQDGIISLSWLQITRELLLLNDDANVVIHEFAHQLDQEFGSATGMPRLNSLQDSLIWGEIFGAEYEKHCRAVQQNQHTVIDIYGATNRVEFFAVVTEVFFLKANLFYTYHPFLYYQLKKYYGVDPLSWQISIS